MGARLAIGTEDTEVARSILIQYDVLRSFPARAKKSFLLADPPKPSGVSDQRFIVAASDGQGMNELRIFEHQLLQRLSRIPSAFQHPWALLAHRTTSLMEKRKVNY